jgi:predicted aspartyl protease
MMYVEGKGVTQDYNEAVKWFRLAAQQGNAKAQKFLGAIFHDGGKGVTQDYKEAAKWYQLAAKQRDVEAQAVLGDIFYDGGKGVTQDYKEAANWYRLAADQGNDDAQFFLGNIYHDGKGVTQDYREAAKWHLLAARQGMARAQLSLGIQYDGGQEGVPQDYLYAYMWLSLAASKLEGVLGEVATRSRNGIVKEMTTAQVLAAQEMAKRCEVSNYKQCDKPEGNQTGLSAASVPMQREKGVYVVPVLINDTITLNFVVDSGASDVSIPADVVMTLMRTGTLKATDFQGEKKYKLADGSMVPSQTFRIRSLKIGSKIVESVTGSITSEKGGPLLGQSFLGRFKSWSVDNTKNALVLE